MMKPVGQAEELTLLWAEASLLPLLALSLWNTVFAIINAPRAASRVLASAQ